MEFGISRKQFIELYAEKMGISRRKATPLVKGMIDLLAQCIVENDTVILRGLGVFEKKTRKARRVGDLRNGGAMEIPEKEVVVFRLANNAGVTKEEDEDEE